MICQAPCQGFAYTVTNSSANPRPESWLYHLLSGPDKSLNLSRPVYQSTLAVITNTTHWAGQTTDSSFLTVLQHSSLRSKCQLISVWEGLSLQAAYLYLSLHFPYRSFPVEGLLWCLLLWEHKSYWISAAFSWFLMILIASRELRGAISKYSHTGG